MVHDIVVMWASLLPLMAVAYSLMVMQLSAAAAIFQMILYRLHGYSGPERYGFKIIEDNQSTRTTSMSALHSYTQ